MSTWLATIIDTGGRADFWEVARAHHVSPLGDGIPPQALIDGGSGFDVESSMRLAQALSAALGTHAAGLFLQTGADVYGVRAFEHGQLVRRLDYSRDGGGWLRVEGTPQRWESSLLFDGPLSLGADLSWPDTLDDDLGDADLARYEAARSAGDPGAVLDLVHPSGGGIHRVARALGVDPDRPAGRYRRPSLWARMLGR